MEPEEIKKLLGTFPPHLEAVLIVNDKSATDSEGTLFLELFAGANVPDERFQEMMETVGFLFCPDHDDEWDDPDHLCDVFDRMLEEKLGKEPEHKPPPAQSPLNLVDDKDIAEYLNSLLKKDEPS